MKQIDRIKQMNAEELAKEIVYKTFLNSISRYFYEKKENMTIEEMQVYIIKMWLESEVEE